MSSRLTLDRVKSGADAVVADVSGDRHLARRLMEMGLTLGATLRVVRRAPFGDPIEVYVRGYHLTLRSQEAGNVIVTVT